MDVNSIVSQLMTVEQRPLLALARKEASYQAQLSAYGSIKGALSSFQSAVSGLSNASRFQGLTATSSDTSIITASAASSAVAGAYSIDAITSLAQAQKLAAAGQASSTAAIGTGTLTFDFGTISGGTFSSVTGKYTGATFTSSGAGTKTVTIDATNNSLQGIRDAINAAKIGVTATIVNDGGASPYRLALSSDSIGKTNSIKISVAGDAGLSSL
ncbi:MAG: flagellar hook protein, partial [Gallionellaceae bacterium]|nr:flagellar hook protein [Gallionellaceae bacterium]